jgi:hypothetical protein
LKYQSTPGRKTGKTIMSQKPFVVLNLHKEKTDDKIYVQSVVWPQLTIERIAAASTFDDAQELLQMATNFKMILDIARKNIPPAHRLESIVAICNATLKTDLQ